MPDVIVIGGGVIGLSIAWELAGQGVSVRVLEQSVPGREASWAGAGMLPPGSLKFARTPEARLRGATNEIWPEWSASLRSATGVDNGYVRCGGIEARLAGASSETIPFLDEIAALRAEGVVVETDDIAVIRDRIPALGPDVVCACYLPDYCQVRNPRHLKALQIGCAMRCVELTAGAPVHRIETQGDRIERVLTGNDSHVADQYVIAGGGVVQRTAAAGRVRNEDRAGQRTDCVAAGDAIANPIDY